MEKSIARSIADLHNGVSLTRIQTRIMTGLKCVLQIYEWPDGHKIIIIMNGLLTYQLKHK